jgi:predicted dehydrogenase
MANLRIGLLGAGWVNEVHAKCILKQPDVSIVAVYNHHLEKAQAFNSKLLAGKAECFDDWRQMLTTQKLDALYVGIPPGAHVGQTELAAEQGIHLMLEKPIALTSERAESIANAVRKAGVLCQIGHHMRHSAPAIKLKQMLVDGSAGRPLFMQGRFFANDLFPAWWRDPKMGGGQLIEQAIHVYDMARYFFGEADVISAFADNLNHHRFADYKVDDISASVVRFKNGSIASICASNCAEPNAGSVTFAVQCEKVVVDFSAPDTATFIHHGGKVSGEISRGEGTVHREYIKGDYNMYDELSANFIGAIRNGSPLRSSIEDGVNSLKLVLAASRSASSNGATQAL